MAEDKFGVRVRVGIYFIFSSLPFFNKIRLQCEFCGCLHSNRGHMNYNHLTLTIPVKWMNSQPAEVTGSWLPAGDCGLQQGWAHGEPQFHPAPSQGVCFCHVAWQSYGILYFRKLTCNVIVTSMRGLLYELSSNSTGSTERRDSKTAVNTDKFEGKEREHKCTSISNSSAREGNSERESWTG